MLLTIFLAVVSFVGTNLDDIFLLTLFFSETKAKREQLGIALGQYLGVLILYGISILGALGLSFLPEKYIGFLGILPILLGLKALFSREEEERTNAVGGAFRVMLVTVANGADNIGVYVPLFTGASVWELLVMGLVFLLMTALWCVIGRKLSALPLLRGFLLKYRRILVPLVLILLGVYILSGVIFA